MVVWGSRAVSHSLHKTFNHHKSASGAKLERHDNCSLPAQQVQQNGFTSGFTVSVVSSEHLQRSAKCFLRAPGVQLAPHFKGVCDGCDFNAFRTKGASLQLKKKTQMFHSTVYEL